MERPFGSHVSPPRPPYAARWTVVVAWMGVIFAMSARSDSGQQSHWLTRQIMGVLGVAPEPTRLASWEHVLRKGSHFTEYAVLAMLLFWALGPRRWRAPLAWLVATLYACTDEFHQRFVPTRGPSPWDVGIDSSGALTALVVVGVVLALGRGRARRGA